MTFWKGLDLNESLFSLGHVDSSVESALLTHSVSTQVHFV